MTICSQSCKFTAVLPAVSGYDFITSLRPCPYNPELLDMVDKKKIGLVQGVDLSFLDAEAQQWVQVILEETDK